MIFYEFRQRNIPEENIGIDGVMTHQMILFIGEMIILFILCEYSTKAITFQPKSVVSD